MANILDYLAWRGDLPFSVSPFNDIDALILCQISYLDFGGIVSADFKNAVTLSDAAKRFLSASDFAARSETGALINKLTVTLLKEAGASRRFGDILACGYKTQLDYQKEEQFCALTFLTEKRRAFVAFRGTDDTILGWKEDFNMGVLETVPAQKDAVMYLTEAMKSIHKIFSIGGHSKGGNLAIFAAAKIDKKFKRRIDCVYNNDGPGFRDEVIASEEFQALVPKLHSFYPQFSIVGMLFSQMGAYTVVESDERGIMQHDPFSWHLMRTSFVALSGFDEASRAFHKTFNTWFGSLSETARANFVESLFKVIYATEARTNSELEKNWLANSARIIAALAKLDAESRDNVIQTMRLLFQIAQKNLPQIKMPRIFR